MKSRRPNRIAELRKARGMTQAQLAEKVDAHWVTISRLERGELQLNQEWLDLLSIALQCSQNAIINWDAPKSTVYLSGKVLIGSKVEIFESQNEFELPSDPTDDQITSWLKVEDNTGWPFLRQNDLLKFIHVHEWEAKHYISHLCMVFSHLTGDGVLGFLEKGSAEDLFDMRPFVGKTIENIAVDRLCICAEIRFHMPWPQPV